MPADKVVWVAQCPNRCAGIRGHVLAKRKSTTKAGEGLGLCIRSHLSGTRDFQMLFLLKKQ